MNECDVVVVGAGPAGATAARGLALRGLRVLLLERARFPRTKVCGACLGPAAQSLLEREGLGSLPERLGGLLLATLDLRAAERAASIPLRRNRVLTRARFDEALVQAAVHAGVEFRDGCRVRAVREDRSGTGSILVETASGDLRARVVVDATGLAGLPGTERSDGRGVAHPEARIGVAAELDAGAELEREGPPPGVLRMVVGKDGYVGAVRTQRGTLNVAAALAPVAVRAHGVGGAVEAVLSSGGASLRGAGTAEWTGTPVLTRSHTRLGGARRLRIGDAAGYVEPFTGEGIGWAIATGAAVRPFVERAVEGWHESIVEAWTAHHCRLVGRSHRLCGTLAAGLRREFLVRGAIAVLGRTPALARPLVVATGRTPRGAPAGVSA